MVLDFRDQVVLITGSASGIGRVAARMFGEAGARIWGVDVAPPDGTAVGRCQLEVDVSDNAAVGRAVEAVLAAEERVDCLINNAGVSLDAAIWNMTETQWDRVLDVNLKGAYNFIHHLAPCFRRRRRGKIVNVSSINGLRGKFGQSNYAAAKAGLIGLTKSVARELGPSNVNVNAVAPGLVLTPMIEALPDEYRQIARDEAVLGRLAEPEDVARTILFLCSDWARQITGEVIRVDGGQYL